MSRDRRWGQVPVSVMQHCQDSFYCYKILLMFYTGIRKSVLDSFDLFINKFIEQL